MTSVTSIQNKPNMTKIAVPSPEEAQGSRKIKPGITQFSPGNMRIRSLSPTQGVQGVQLQTQDRMLVKPEIRKLSLSINEQSSQGQAMSFQIKLKNGQKMIIPSSRLNQDKLNQHLELAAAQVDLKQVNSFIKSNQSLLQTIRSEISGKPVAPPPIMNLQSLEEKAPEFKGPGAALPEALRNTPRVQSSLGKLSDMMASVRGKLNQLEDKLKTLPKGKSRRVAKRAYKRLSRDLKQLNRVMTKRQDVKPEQRAELLTSRLQNRILKHLGSVGSSQEKTQRVQAWAEKMQEKATQNPNITPQDMLDGLSDILHPSERKLFMDSVKSGFKEEMATLFNLQKDPGFDQVFQDVMGQALTADDLGRFADFADMEPDGLLLFMDSIGDMEDIFQSQALPELEALNLDLSYLTLQVNTLSEEAKALINDADELAKQNLSPTPEAAKGFEDGALSLIRYFLEIIRQLDKDVSQIYLEEMARKLETRALSSDFLSQLQDNQLFDQQSRQLKGDIEALLQGRFAFIAQNLTQALV